MFLREDEGFRVEWRWSGVMGDGRGNEGIFAEREKRMRKGVFGWVCVRVERNECLVNEGVERFMSEVL